MRLKINLLPPPGVHPTRRQLSIISMVALSVFLISSLWFGQSLLLYVIALTIVGVAIFMHPQIGLYLILLGTVWFERHFTLQELWINLQPYKIYPLDFIILLTVASVIVLFLKGERKLPRWTFIDIAIVLFGAVAFIGFIRGMFGAGQTSLAFSTFKNYFLYSIVYFLAIILLDSKKAWKDFMHYLMVAGFGLFFFLAYGIAAGQGLWSEFTPLSTLGSRLIAGTHIYYFIIFAFWIIGYYLWRGRDYKVFERAILFTLAGVAVGIVVSLVRHLWLALFVMGIVWLYVLAHKQRKRLVHITWVGTLFLGITGLVVIWISLLLTQFDSASLAKQFEIVRQRASISSVIRLQDTSFAWRVSVWRSALDLWGSSPIHGVGMGLIVNGVHEVTPFEIPVRDLHNNYLGILMQLGIIGLGVVIWWFGSLLRILMNLWRRLEHKPGFDRQLLFAWGNTMLLFMIVFFISVYWDINLFIIFWWFALAAIRYLLVKYSRDKRNIIWKV